ncbi:hypothetical protein TWF694_003936 [Orbilia ellipsospora]|uniref:RlpA-like protein double-psi beta-barrel domain-containing protein n=1 Tax=Orbilia ellipsospora TaxID=2528407 RepID=A0AAV9WXD4_9PEZI
MAVGIFERFHPNSGLRQWARSRTFAGTSKPHSLYICGFRRKNFYKLMFLIFLIVLAIASVVGISVSNRVKRIRAQRNGIVGANGSRQGITLPGSKIFVPTTTRTIQEVTRIGNQLYTIQYEQPEGITYAFSKGSIIPGTSYLPLNTNGPATFTFGRIITIVEGGSTRVQDGTTSVIGPTATMTSNGEAITLGSSTTIVGASTSISGGRTLTTFTSVPYTVTNLPSSGVPSSSVKVLIYNDPGGALSSSSSRKVVILSSASTTSSTSSSSASSQTSTARNTENTLPSSLQSSAPTPSSESGSGGNGGSSIGMGQTFSGDATFYDPGLGSCGITNSGSDLIAAIGHTLFDSKATANSNNNPFCGRQIAVRPKGGFSRRFFYLSLMGGNKKFNSTNYQGDQATFGTEVATGLNRHIQNGKGIIQGELSHSLKKRAEVTITVVDRCGGCAEYDLDLSPAAFNMIADPRTGRVPIDWRWV